MKRAGYSGAFQRLRGTELLSARHEARHLDLRQLDVLAPERGQADVLNLVVSHDDVDDKRLLSSYQIVE